MAGTFFSGRNSLQQYSLSRILMGLVALAGIWQIVSPYVLSFAAEQTAFRNAVVCGVLLMIFGLVGVFGAGQWNQSLVRTFEGLASLTGLWLALSPWVLQYQMITSAFWSAFIVGLFAFICAGFATSKQGAEISAGA